MSSERKDEKLRELTRATKIFIRQLANALNTYANVIERIEKSIGTTPTVSPYTTTPPDATVPQLESTSPPQATPPPSILSLTPEQIEGGEETQQGPDIYSIKSLSGSDTSLSDAAEKVLESQVGAIEDGLKAKQGSRLKIALAGRAAVGKTTIFNLLKGLKSPGAYHATIGADVDRKLFQIDGTRVIVWDLAGQQEYHKTWVIFLRGAALILFVTDSSVENVVGSKPLLDLCRRVEPSAEIICIANKQDLPGRLKPEEIHRQLGVRTYGCVAVDTAYREAIMNIIVDIVRDVISKGTNPLDQSGAIPAPE
ncbi:MAG: GTP-binding protein [Candidatus Atabeyarchaeum deiterrae]